MPRQTELLVLFLADIHILEMSFYEGKRIQRGKGLYYLWPRMINQWRRRARGFGGVFTGSRMQSGSGMGQVLKTIGKTMVGLSKRALQSGKAQQALKHVAQGGLDLAAKKAREYAKSHAGQSLKVAGSKAGEAFLNSLAGAAAPPAPPKTQNLSEAAKRENKKRKLVDQPTHHVIDDENMGGQNPPQPVVIPNKKVKKASTKKKRKGTKTSSKKATKKRGRGLRTIFD